MTAEKLEQKQWDSLVDVLRYRAETEGEKRAFTYLVDGEKEEVHITYGELDQRARIIAGALQQRGCENERVLLLYPPGLEFIAAFFGCLYAGSVAVPCYPPRLNRPDARLQAIVHDTRAKVALTDTTIHSSLEQRYTNMEGFETLEWIDSIKLDDSQVDLRTDPQVNRETLAFLQYTSGSTATPKGVMVTHGNLLHNFEAMSPRLEHTDNSLFVVWIPPYHDMGLIGNLLQSVYQGIPTVQMSPASFLQRPFRWLQAMSRYKATFTSAPNFAFDLCVQKVTEEQKATLDLSNWKVAVNAAEPVRGETIEAFANAFESCGFRRETFLPSFGMAETTLVVSGGHRVAQPIVKHFEEEGIKNGQILQQPKANNSTQAVVACGAPLQDMTVVIADPEAMEQCPDTKSGEIWVSGPSVAQGYWDRKEATEETFNAYLKDSKQGPFLRTGDIGFLNEGELYILGRLKDLIIIHGQNFYPQDIEKMVEESHQALQIAGGAAFSTTVNGEERLIVVQEFKRGKQKSDPEEITRIVRSTLSEQLGIELFALVLIKPMSIPKTTSGKIQRKACKQLWLEDGLKVVHNWSLQQAQPAISVKNTVKADGQESKKQQEVKRLLVEIIAKEMGLGQDSINTKDSFSDFGMGSVQLMGMLGELEEKLNQKLDPTLVWEYSTIESLSAYLSNESEESVDNEQTATTGVDNEPIAIIGIGCRFPGANGADQFWQLLNEGRDAITEIPNNRWNHEEFYHEKADQPGKSISRWGGFIDHVDQFDAAFFGISPIEADRMDPQQRLLLETSYEALEDAGQLMENLKGSSTAVYIGISTNEYSHIQNAAPELLDAYAGSGNGMSVAANRISYFYDFQGPSLSIDTACSSSLVAVHHACQNLREGTAKLALAGGVNLILTPSLSISFTKSGMLSPDGRCKPFDSRANGYVRSEGVGLVVLKRLDEALADSDSIYSVIHGSAINHGGQSNGLMAPNPKAQKKLIREACQQANVAPQDIAYVETHGTGTFLGDPIEAKALGAALKNDDSKRSACLIGAVKSNIGHLESAAGVAGLIKVALSMKNKRIPKTLHYEEANPHIPFEELNLRVVNQPEVWPEDRPMVAGVSSFGFGGTNAHVILKQAPSMTKVVEKDKQNKPLLLPLSARSEGALQALAKSWLDFLQSPEKADEPTLKEICYTAALRRSHHEHRLVLIASSKPECCQLLKEWLSAKKPASVMSNQTDTPEHALAVSYVEGNNPNWKEQTAETCNTVALPNYPWQHERFWLETGNEKHPCGVNQWGIQSDQSIKKTETVIDGELTNWMHEIQWQPLEKKESTETENTANHWILLGDDQGIAKTLAEKLIQEGKEVILLQPGKTLKQRSENEWTVNPDIAEQWQQFLNQLPASFGESPVNLVHLWSLNETVEKNITLQTLEQAQTTGTMTLVHLIRELNSSDRWKQAKLWITTAGAQQVSSVQNGIALPQSTVWGFARTLVMERSSQFAGIIDLDPTASAVGNGNELYEELRQDVAEKQIAIRLGERYVPRLIQVEQVEKKQTIEWRPDAAYLITGGLGDLGLLIAKWMVKQGARRLILMGRTPLPARTEWSNLDPASTIGKKVTALRELEHMGAALHLMATDVANEKELTTALRQYEDEGWPEIRGVIHAAGIVKRELIQDLDRDALDQILAPKVAGGWLLHNLLKEKTLDFFTLFSSITALSAPPRLAHYGAANSFLDGLAHYRQSLNLPATTLNWTMWDEIGMDARNRDSSEQNQQAMKPLSATKGLQLFGSLLPSQRTQTVLIDADWSLWKKQYASMIDLNFFSILLDSKNDERKKNRPEASFIRKIAEEPKEKQLKQLELLLQKEFGAILGMEASKVDTNTVTHRFGFDSLMGIALKNRVEGTTGVEISLSDLLEGITIKQLAKNILAELETEQSDQEDQTSIDHRSIQPISRNQDLPLSFGQQRLFFIDRFEGESSVYNIPFALQLKGTVNRENLNKAFELLIQRHESLRTVFVDGENGAIQKIRSNTRFGIEEKNLADLSPKKRESEIQRIKDEEIAKPFDLQNDLLIRAQLLLLSDDQSLLLLTVHHIVSDGWSFRILANELGQIYNALQQGASSPLAPLKLQYADFAWWQQQNENREALNRSVQFWKEQLEGIPDVHNLRTDYSRPAKQKYDGNTLYRSISKETLDSLNAMATEKGMTLFMIIQTAFSILLSRYSGETDIVIGTPVTERPHSDLEKLIGFFVNTVILRNNLSGNPTLQTLLERVRTTTLEAYQHQAVPFERLVDELQPERSMARNPLFQVELIALAHTEENFQFSELEVNRVPLSNAASAFDLTLSYIVGPDGLKMEWKYCTALFEQSTIEQMGRHLDMLLRSMVENPTQPVQTLSMLTKSERNKLLVEWNQTEKDYPADKNVHQLFEEQAASSPDSIAIMFEEQSLTYGELNQKANQLAHYLIDAGIKPGDRIGLCLDRSLSMSIGLLATLKTGAAYVPLDPIYPVSRLQMMLDDAEVKLLLTQEKSRSLFKQQNIIALDKVQPEIDLLSVSNPIIEVSHESPVYVIYTSGSTGKPKGVSISHKNLVNFIYSMKETPGFTKKDTLLSVTTICFDIFGLEFYLPLLFGGVHYLVSSGVAMDGEALINHLEKSGATIMQATPATWHLLLEENWKPTGLFKALCGGEALPRKLAQSLLDLDGVELWNMYGPTETTIWSSVEQIIDANEPITIGKPIANTTIHILDENLEPVPVKTVGEIFIGGDGVALGYHNRDELTKERFISNPHGKSGEKLYQTGDLGVYLPDGRIDCLGRKDHQVKIRGFRIELGDIETTLQSHPSTKECVVIVGENNPGDKTLWAYMVADGTESDSFIEELRKLIHSQLPEYMMPSRFIVLDRLPKTNNGKINRKELPKPEKREAIEGGFQTPESQLEIEIHAAWKEELGIDKIGIHDNFFNIGGHSLILVRLRKKLEKRLNRKVEITKFFEFPTIHQLANFLASDTSQEVVISDKDIRKTTQTVGSQNRDIAVISMCGRFPGASNVDQFWENLKEGKESREEFSDEKLREIGVEEEMINHPNYVKSRMMFDDISLFDAAFFGYTPRDADIIDPQQRLLLEGGWTVLENAGYDPSRYDGWIGVFVGTNMSGYFLENITGNEDLIRSTGVFPLMFGNDKDFVATRLAYHLGLKGPAITVQTACSTSLVAVHTAAENLRNGKCDMAIAGGASIPTIRNEGYLYIEGEIFSPDGHCRPFDANAGGTVIGRGVGLVLLKRLEDAKQDGDNIHAVIKGTAVNNDGDQKLSFTAPSVSGQTMTILNALEDANISPESISYVEAHGTGTKLGDPIEIRSLTLAYQQSTNKTGYCGIGSVKSNVGHLDATAGVTGLIKTVLSLKHKSIPATLNFQEPNPEIDFENSPFYVIDQLTEWKSETGPRRAGVCSYGIGGTNCHVIVEEAPGREKTVADDLRKLLPISARTNKALKATAQNLGNHLSQNPDLNLSDVAYTLQEGRKALECRQFVVCRSSDEAIKQLEKISQSENRVTPVSKETTNTVFMFPGQGAQYPDMALDLYREEPTFSESVDFCCDLLQPVMNLDLRTVLFPTLYDTVSTDEAAEQLRQTWITQPALFVIEYALAKLWIKLGVQPKAMIGHSIGEYVAATLSGVLSPEDAMKLVATRGRLIQDLPGGTMLSLSMDREKVESLLNENLSLAASNTSKLCVLSGTTEAVAAVQKQLDQEGVFYRALKTSHAFHSFMMEPILEAFKQELEKVTLNAPEIAYVSNVTGTWITEENVKDHSYWLKHLRGTVLFHEGLETLLSQAGFNYLEVGPGTTLGSFLKQRENAPSQERIIASLRHPSSKGSDMDFFYQSIGKGWTIGLNLQWDQLRRERQYQRAQLPTYPFERQSYWIENRSQQGGNPHLVKPEVVECQTTEQTETTGNKLFPRPDVSTEYVAPTNDVETTLTRTCQELLGFEKVGVHDNFFELGGHSLLAANYLAKVRELFGFELSLAEFFEQPTPALIAEKVAEFLASGPGVETLKQSTIPLVDRNQMLPLSVAQQRLWFLNRLEGASSAYNLLTALRLTGEIQVAVLEQAINEVVRRHESLRTTFGEQDGEAVQVIHETRTVDFPVIDLQSLPTEKREAEATKLCEEEALTCFDLSSDLMLRAKLIQLSEKESIILLTMHHIASDGWSMEILVQELFTLYQSFLDGEPSPLPELEVQYADYAHWQQTESNESMEEGIEFWKNHLTGLPKVHNLPTDRQRPARQSYDGAVFHNGLSKELTESLKQMAKKKGVTLFMIMQAAFQTLLARYSGETDIVIGSPVAERPMRELNNLIGFFVNTIVLRADLSGNPTFDSLLDQVRKNTLKAYEHQHVPFEKLVEELQPERSMAHNPLFQIELVSMPHEEEEFELNGIKAKSVSVEVMESAFDLSMNYVTEQDQIRMLWNYSTALFDAETISRLASHLETLLQSIVENSNRPVQELPMLSNSERHQLLVELNQTKTEYPKEKSLQQLFEEQSQKTPDAIAIAFEGESLTYKELNQKANQLAHYLIAQDVRPGDLVGICLNRSLNMLVGLLATLKTGAAYVPLDPIYPVGRLIAMLDDAKVKRLLTEQSLRDLFPKEEKNMVIWEEANQTLNTMDDSNPQVEMTSESLAYVIYTSGTTGKPKGVCITHRNLVNFLITMREKPGFTEKDTLLSVTTVCFDIFGLELYLPLISGGTHYLVSSVVAIDANQLIKHLNESGATVMQATPTTWKLLLDANWTPTTPIKVLCGGEALPKDLATALTASRQVELWNMYGPTETTIWSSVEQISGEQQKIAIGKPIANTQFYLLDESLSPVPMGTIGEIYIGGDGVAPGYLKRPELTNEKFQNNPFDPTLGKIYQTGDLGQYLPDGRIECLGRKDQQVKIRGFRIELGEIESTLIDHRSVREAVVVAGTTDDGESVLWAYMVTDGTDQDQLSSELRTLIRSRLPEYMMPSSFTVLDQLPLTNNGKIDRKRLPKPETATVKRALFKEADSQLEETILNVWKEVLNLETISVHDNFFDVGGHSLKMIKLKTELEKELKQEIEITTLFEFPTVQQLADFLDNKTSDSSQNSADKILQRSESRKVSTKREDYEIAVIGLYGRFPGAKTLDQFWDNLKEGREALRTFSDDELREAGVDESLIQNPNYVKSKMMLEDIDRFDAPFFGFTKRNAEIADPQQRFLLEGSWNLLENAGYVPEKYPGRVGVFVGTSLFAYFLNHIVDNEELIADAGLYPLLIGNEKDFAATRISYHLGLEGPSIAVQTACSTSLVAAHMAADNLRKGECDMAIAGASTMLSTVNEGYLYIPGEVNSPDGHCRPFDADAQGTVFGSGIGLLLLKRLSDALEDNDHIHAVIKGSAINNDGLNKVGYTAPSIHGQSKVILNAFKDADVSPESISYMEAHGTGTKMGDPMEIAALTMAYKQKTDRKGFCGIGSVKGNVGHLDSAAGVTGAIKIILSMKNEQLPPTANFKRPNPEINFEESPFRMVEGVKSWTRSETPRRAAISSFGIGGTNVHMILEEPPVNQEKQDTNKPKLLPLSARSKATLQETVQNLKEHLAQNPTLNLDDVAFTLQQGRKEFNARHAVVCYNREDAILQLDQLPEVSVIRNSPGKVFMFPGQGAQYPNMALGIYQEWDEFKNIVDHCCELLKPTLGLDLRTLLFPDLFGTLSMEEAANQLRQTAITQPALFVVEYALAKLWISLTGEPAAMIGHSVGEYVAATISGVFSPEDALSLIALRGRLIQQLPEGKMISVSLSKEALRPFLCDGLSVAAHNTTNLFVLSGTAEIIDEVKERLEQKEVFCRELVTSHAFHSLMMEPILESFEKAIKKVPINSPQIPYVSNVTGDWITEKELNDPAYWGKHLRGTVRFDDGINTLMEKDGQLFLEVGPGTTLGSFLRMKEEFKEKDKLFASLRHPKTEISDQNFLYQSIAKLWSNGEAIHWEKLQDNESNYRVPLPGYPFERHRYWIERQQRAPEKKAQSKASEQITKPSQPIPNAKVVVDDSEFDLMQEQLKLMSQHLDLLS